MTAFGLPGGRNSRLFYPIAPALESYNVTSFAVTPPEKRGFLIGMTNSDNSAQVLVIPSLTGWDFSLISMNGDASATANVAIWIGRPNPQVIDVASGSTMSLFNASVGGTYTTAVFRQFNGTFRGQLIASAFNNAASAASVTVSAPTGPMRMGNFMCLAAAHFTSGGAGPNAGTDLRMPDVQSYGSGALGSLRIGTGVAPGILVPSTVFSAGRSQRWTSTYLVIR